MHLRISAGRAVAGIDLEEGIPLAAAALAERVIRYCRGFLLFGVNDQLLPELLVGCPLLLQQPLPHPSLRWKVVQ